MYELKKVEIDASKHKLTKDLEVFYKGANVSAKIVKMTIVIDDRVKLHPDENEFIEKIKELI